MFSSPYVLTCCLISLVKGLFPLLGLLCWLPDKILVKSRKSRTRLSLLKHGMVKTNFSIHRSLDKR